jgi:hypothetical protein
LPDTYRTDSEFSLKDIGNRFKTDKVFLIESCKINETMNYDVK